MTDILSKTLPWALASIVVAAVLGGCRTSGEAPDMRPADGLASAQVDGGSSGEGGDSAGLPCDVEQLLSTKCAGCHSSTPSAPMALVTFADLTAPAKSDPSKRVFELALERITSADRPMPPSAPMTEADITTFATWAKAGAPKSACVAAEAGAPRAKLPECVLASDCPGSLVCRNGTCDVECVTDKDCTPTWTCEEARCNPPTSASAADAGAPESYAPFADESSWSVSTPGIPTGSYNGTVFDGRYVYFAPDSAGGSALRYDTKASFKSANAWATFDLLGVDASAKNYRGAVFDGRYVYFVPSSAGARFARYDTQAAYLDAASWMVFDLKTVNAAIGFSGATFDGRYVYLAPSSPTAATFRYDTAGAMNNPASWSTFTVTTIDPKARTFVGAIYDGHYVYLVPNGGTSDPSGVIARYDAEAPFGVASSWSTLDLTTLNPSASGYRTGAFDGRYLYLVPGWTAPTPTWSSSTIARFDTHGLFADSPSWSFFDTKTVDPSASGFNAAAFDGRRLVLAPGFNGDYHGVTLGFDTQGEMTDPASWSKLDVSGLAANARNLRGASFDGKYVYLAPASGVAVRFAAKSTASSAGRASFY